MLYNLPYEEQDESAIKQVICQTRHILNGPWTEPDGEKVATLIKSIGDLSLDNLFGNFMDGDRARNGLVLLTGNEIETLVSCVAICEWADKAYYPTAHVRHLLKMRGK